MPHWIKHNLRLYRPLWVCLLLAVLALLLLPSSATLYTWVFLFFGYFLATYLWRKHLKKRGQLGKAGSGLFFLIAFSVAGLYVYHSATAPESPQLVMYETSDPAVFSSTDHHPAAEATRESEAAEILSNHQRRGRFGSLTGMLVDEVGSLHDSGLSCAFLKQHKLIAQCSSDTFQETVRVELDNNSATIELLVVEKEPEQCIQKACQVWLLQTTDVNIDQFTEVRIENNEQGKVPPIADATLIAQWDNVVTPVVVFNTSSNGWRHLQMTNPHGSVVTWKKPQ